MGNIAKKAFPVLNMHCAGCANNVEKTVKKLPGVVDASVNFASNRFLMRTTSSPPEKSVQRYLLPVMI